jgi:hypothetical protein
MRFKNFTMVVDVAWNFLLFPVTRTPLGAGKRAKAAPQQRRRSPLSHTIAKNCASSQLSYTYRIEEPLHSRVGCRSRATLKKRITINLAIPTL